MAPGTVDTPAVERLMRKRGSTKTEWEGEICPENEICTCMRDQLNLQILNTFAPLYFNVGMRRSFGDANMMKRLGLPEEIASAVLFLASDESSFATGEMLVVDGGQTIF